MPYCYRPSVVGRWVCPSVCHVSEPLKNGSTDRNAVWLMDSGGLREACIRWVAHWRHLTNTTEPSMCGDDDAAFIVKLLWPLVYVCAFFLLDLLTLAAWLQLRQETHQMIWRTWTFYDDIVHVHFYAVRLRRYEFGEIMQNKGHYVADLGTNRKLVYEFLLVLSSNLSPVLHRFRDI